MPCFAAHRKQVVEAHVESTGAFNNKKIALVIENVRVDEIKAIMEFIAEMRIQAERTKKSL